jgi:hypothetical protein
VSKYLVRFRAKVTVQITTCFQAIGGAGRPSQDSGGEARVTDEVPQGVHGIITVTLHEVAKLIATEFVRNIIIFYGGATWARPAVGERGEPRTSIYALAASWSDWSFTHRDGAEGRGFNYMLPCRSRYCRVATALGRWQDTMCGGHTPQCVNPIMCALIMCAPAHCGVGGPQK